jgi:acyl-coenzyme A synthetase/AMP-(fatty) acid ligase
VSGGPTFSDRSSAALYERWDEIARARGRDLAIAELPGRRWSFADLRHEAERGGISNDPMVFPQGNGAEFVIKLLRAWRRGSAACPMEQGQAVPSIALPPRCAHLKLTSGSTGSPKCILFTAAQLAADPRNIVATMGLRPDWPNLALISLAHSYGFSNLVLPLLLHGIPMIAAPAPLPEVLRRAGREFGAMTLPAVPALWRTWLAADCIPATVRLAISAGAPLPLELERSIFERHGLKIHNFYGSTECGAIAYDRTEQPRTDAAAAGSAAEGVELEVGPSGTLEVKSEAVGWGYWPEAQSELGDGRFVTSDRAELISGVVRLRGRTSDIINVAGRKVAPEVVEQQLRQHPSVRECVVFGAPSDAGSRWETIVAVVRTARESSAAELAAFLSERLPAWQIPREWWFTDALAPDQRGKVSRAEWKRRYLEA